MKFRFLLIGLLVTNGIISNDQVVKEDISKKIPYEQVEKKFTKRDVPLLRLSDFKAIYENMQANLIIDWKTLIDNRYPYNDNGD